jgi:hypothetical protein
MSSHVGTVGIGGFPSEKEAAIEELGDNTHQAPQILTFPLSNESPDAC